MWIIQFRALTKGSEEQLQGSEAASQAIRPWRTGRLCADGAADRGVPGGVTAGAKVEAGLSMTYVRHGVTEGLLGRWGRYWG